MANVNIRPMPRKYRKIPARWRPQHPPIFDGDPTPEDRELARALFDELDPESQAWYRASEHFPE
jgi:hypothetical protein